MDKEKFEELGFAYIDKFREKRTGAPEAVFCPGKTPEQIADIMKALAEEKRSSGNSGNIIATRATENDYDAVKKILPEAEYHKKAGIISVSAVSETEKKGRIAVVTAGTADIPVAEEAAVTGELLGNHVERIYDVGVAGIHRLFDRLEDIRCADVIIVIAGMEGALASVVSGLVESPVIAVPTSIGYGANFEGLAALLSMINSCADGVGVVNIDNGYGAACLASKINRRAL